MEQEFSKNLRDWYRKNGRKLPWRETKDPYKIWLSEIILQQTRVDQGLPYYLKLTSLFPDVHALANAPLDNILRQWQGLGYYSRARNLHEAAKQVVIKYKGVFPSDYISIRALKGIGDYTAAAVASFSFDLPYPVLDGNVYRFLARLTGNGTPIDSSSGKKEFYGLATELMDPDHAAEHNQAMMELGATVCKPDRPLCDECPFSLACYAYIYGKTAQLPVKKKIQKVRRRYFHYFFYNNNLETIILPRKKKDIWQGLYEFPLLETSEENIDIQSIKLNLGLNLNHTVIEGSPLRFRHLLSHQELIAHFWKVNVKGALQEIAGSQKILIEDIHQYAFPQLIVRFLQKEGIL